ncbi:RNA polymerase II transcription factor B subunit 5 [Zea mays]|uniref:General transcription and DNA repair factor IIH subunit TFB5 n=1 Tax=Zea mays TaxID=4577 RepID=A0A1D6KGG6_MAIZE|nr:RNA polymerase II transcription factor B subunit 5 [Zea mays]
MGKLRGALSVLQSSTVHHEDSKMVNVIKGLLFISCDVPMAQLIVNLNASMPPSEKFIVHMLVHPRVAEMIRSKISEFRDQNIYEKPQ